MAERQFCKKCGKCRERAVVLAAVSYMVSIDHDGRKYTITIPNFLVPRCGQCGTIVLDDEANRQISAALRHDAGLLPPEQIRRHRIALGLTQQVLADLLGVSVSTLSRWESGAQIQPRSLDRFLRAFFTVSPLRRALRKDHALDLPELPGTYDADGNADPSQSEPLAGIEGR